MSLLLRILVCACFPVLQGKQSGGGVWGGTAAVVPWGSETQDQNGEAAGLYLPAAVSWACERPPGSRLPS